MADLNTTLPTPSSTTPASRIEVTGDRVDVYFHQGEGVTPVTEDTPDLTESKFGDVNGDGHRNFDDVKALAGKASDKAGKAADKVSETADKVMDMAGQAADKAKGTLSSLKDRILGNDNEEATDPAASVVATPAADPATSAVAEPVTETPAQPPVEASTSRFDFNKDGVVNFQDLLAAATSPIDAASQLFGLNSNSDLGIVSFISGLFSSLIELDRNGDGQVNLDDLRHEFGLMSTSLSSLFDSVRDRVNPTQLLSTLGVSSSNNVSLSINSVEEGVLAAKRTLAKTSVDSNSVPVAEDAVGIFGETRSVSDMALSNDPSNDATSKSLFERIVSFAKKALQFAKDLMIPELLIAVLPTIITGVQNLTGNSNFNGLDSLFEALVAFTPEGSATA